MFPYGNICVSQKPFYLKRYFFVYQINGLVESYIAQLNKNRQPEHVAIRKGLKRLAFSFTRSK